MIIIITTNIFYLGLSFSPFSILQNNINSQWPSKYGLVFTAIMAPDIITFCLSGGTPVNENSCILNTSGGSSAFNSTSSYLSLPHFTFTTHKRSFLPRKQPHFTFEQRHAFQGSSSLYQRSREHEDTIHSVESSQRRDPADPHYWRTRTVGARLSQSVEVNI